MEAGTCAPGRPRGIAERPVGGAAPVSACQPNAKRLLISQCEALRPLPSPLRLLCLGHNCLGHLSNSVINCFGEGSSAA